ncbi:PP2C family protein-serine/threonine phosphatase [Acetivibrio cellulolyticus]|uniref:PP2C family protein-serine/threonine phosphatase n=1 Tax=Acetivibrio cellulolyticus TaxID=35830 RepID=UPI0001E2BDBC|nr:protein phosphatase 2C domain-containing protein [Acetivibrio cellulolyticus]
MDKMLKIDASVITEKGNVRTKNEDNFFLDGLFMQKSDNSDFCKHSLNSLGHQFVFAVCDGMGGEELGEEASFLAVQSLSLMLKSSESKILSNIADLRDFMSSYIEKSNALIFENSLSAGKRMGTTLASILFFENKAIALNIGDSRVYLFRDSNLIKLTNDHTESERLIRLGLLDKEVARFHKSNNILTRHLGIDPQKGRMEADYSDEFNVLKGDTYLICSDGLSNTITYEELKNSLSSSNDSAALSKNLVDLAFEKKGIDNVTAMIIRITDINDFIKTT